MLKRFISTCCGLAVLSYPEKLIKKARTAFCAMLVFTALTPIQSFAEGSKEINANGGYRAYLFSSPVGNSSYPFPTQGTMKVYVNVGETINVGSSVQGMNQGTINLRAPDGTTYTSGNDATTGFIADHNQELAGPQPNVGGYKPFTVKVKAGQEGVWEIDFISNTGGQDQGNPDAIPANVAWTQPTGQYIAAFDVSVRNTDNTAFLKGRVFTNVFSGILGTFDVGFNGIFHILTSDGYQYTLDNNGQAGNGFTFFVNNKGFKNPDGTASYKSVNFIDNPDVQDPRVADSPSDITQKIFFNTPAADLPASANTPGGGTTWLLKAPLTPAITKMAFTGIEGIVGVAGTNPLGANFTFDASVAGDYVISIDVNQNGSFTDAVDRKLTGAAIAGTNTVYWNGLDGTGNKVPADTLSNYIANITLTTKAGEVHFPFFDVERNVNGIKLTRINGSRAPDDTVYWNDSQIPPIGTPSNPVINLKGLSSLVNGHKWGSPTQNPFDQNEFGNNVGIDTWGYISSAPIKTTVSFALQQADLAVDSLNAIANCAGQQVLYTIIIKNNGPSKITGGKFIFSFPPELTGVSGNSSSTSGASSAGTPTVSANAYTADINMDNGAVRTFTINGLIAVTAAGSLNVSAAVLRPADVTDPDATNPDAAPPTDPAGECYAPPSGAGCNNIKTNITAFKSAPDAGPDQTVIRYEPVNLAASQEGMWTQVPGDPAVASFTSSFSASTTVAGLPNLGKYHFVFTNANGCADTLVVTVVTTDMVIPNIFTPNGDGKNDVFKIAGLVSYPGSQLIIFNRWGNEVYNADNYLNDWNGSGLAEGTYYYVLNRRERTGDITTFKGWVFLKRGK